MYVLWSFSLPEGNIYKAVISYLWSRLDVAKKNKIVQRDSGLADTLSFYRVSPPKKTRQMFDLM